jgi:hypothetical protein
MMVGVNSSMLYCKNFCKCHNVPPAQYLKRKESSKIEMPVSQGPCKKMSGFICQIQYTLTVPSPDMLPLLFFIYAVASPAQLKGNFISALYFGS